MFVVGLVYGYPAVYIFVAVFLGCTSTGRVGLCFFLWFYVQELPKAQPAVVLVLKRLSNGLKYLYAHTCNVINIYAKKY